MFSVENKGAQIHITAPADQAIKFSLLFPKLEGRKRMLPDRVFSIEPTGSNLRLVVSRFPEMGEALERLAASAAALESAPRLRTTAEFKYRMPPSPWQVEYAAMSEGQPVFALFAVPGAGKTKAAIDQAFKEYLAGEIDAVIVIAKKGVHTQWVKDALPAHAPEGVPYHGFCHDYLPNSGYRPHKFNWLAVNFDGAKGKTTQELIGRFVRAARRIRIIIDESQEIKNKQSGRWDTCYAIRQKCCKALIMSGTPIAKSLTDYWAQFFMLDEKIIGDRYMTSFRSKYCVMGGYDGQEIVAFQNEAQLYKLTAPFTYRVGRDALGLPPKRYKQIAFDMGPRQRAAYEKMKHQFVTDLDQKGSQAVAHAGSALVRLQQISCGYLPKDDGTVELFEDTRLEAMKLGLVGLEDEKVIIWCRFHHDVDLVLKTLGERAVDYYGKTDDKMRDVNKFRFIEDPDVQYMVSTPAAGGTGIDGYQEVCHNAIYYSNSFNAIHRWQSEDRISRTGMVADHALYIDLIARAAIDRRLLKKLKDNERLSDLMLDDLRAFFNAQD